MATIRRTVDSRGSKVNWRKAKGEGVERFWWRENKERKIMGVEGLAQR